MVHQNCTLLEYLGKSTQLPHTHVWRHSRLHFREYSSSTAKTARLCVLSETLEVCAVVSFLRFPPPRWTLWRKKASTSESCRRRRPLPNTTNWLDRAPRWGGSSTPPVNDVTLLPGCTNRAGLTRDGGQMQLAGSSRSPLLSDYRPLI